MRFGKRMRQEKIRQILQTGMVRTQEELVRELSEAGMAVTQATLSRDIREMGIYKLRMPGGGSAWTSPAPQEEASALEEGREEQEAFLLLFKQAFVSMELAMNLVVLRTSAGMAMALATALDQLGLEGMLGCVAGDDTLFLAAKGPEEAEALSRDLSRFLG